MSKWVDRVLLFVACGFWWHVCFGHEWGFAVWLLGFIVLYWLSTAAKYAD